jgi:hypothetical protein
VVQQATWEIRSGISEGNGGTLVASGTNAATQTATGRSLWGTYPEYTIQVSGLDVTLAPGTYWLAVIPHGFGYGRWFCSTTSGANAVGTPPGNNDNAFFYGPYWNNIWWKVENVLGTGPWDFSMGVADVEEDISGTVTNPAGAPLDSVIVILKNAAGAEVDRDTTGSDGEYEFTDLEDGTYTLEFRRPWYRPNWVRNVTVPPGGEYNVTLRPLRPNG